MSNKLKPCPFCGGKVKMYVDSVDAYNNSYNFWCNNCNMITTYQYSDEEKAIETWNTRKPMEAIVERLEEDRAELFKLKAKCIALSDKEVYACQSYIYERAIEIVKEESGGCSIEV